MFAEARAVHLCLLLLQVAAEVAELASQMTHKVGWLLLLLVVMVLAAAAGAAGSCELIAASRDEQTGTELLQQTGQLCER